LTLDQEVSATDACPNIPNAPPSIMVHLLPLSLDTKIMQVPSKDFVQQVSLTTRKLMLARSIVKMDV
jgi:hypothetical protein